MNETIILILVIILALGAVTYIVFEPITNAIIGYKLQQAINEGFEQAKQEYQQNHPNF